MEAVNSLMSDPKKLPEKPRTNQLSSKPTNVANPNLNRAKPKELSSTITYSTLVQLKNIGDSTFKYWTKRCFQTIRRRVLGVGHAQMKAAIFLKGQYKSCYYDFGGSHHANNLNS